MAAKMQILKTVLRWIFNILCLLVVSLLFLVGVWTRNLNLLWLLIPIALWILAFKRKTANWLALGFLACVVGIVIWLFLPDSGTWRPYNFDYELKDLEAKRAVPDSENAAIAYQKIFARLDIKNAPKFFNEANEPSTHIFWKGSEHPETAAFIDARIDIITDAMAASRMEKCAFPLLTNPLGMPADDLMGVRRLMYLVISAANRDMGEGKIDEALEKYNCLIRAGRQLQYQTTLIQLLVGIAIESLAERQLQSAVIDGRLNEAQFNYIRKIIPTAADDWPKLYPAISENEKLLGKNMFGLMLYEIDEKGTVRFSRNPMPFPKEPAQTIPSPDALHKKLKKLGAISGWFVYPHNPKDISLTWDEEYQRAIKLYDANNANAEQTGLGFYQWMTDPYRSIFRMMTQMLLPAEAKVHETYLRTIAYRRTMHILLALREYKDAKGRWPETLDQIKDKVPAEAMIDPLTGGSFIYRTKGDKFLLYSVGPNKIDEKCEARSCDVPWEQTKNKLDDILIWPQKNEQAKEFFDANSPAIK